MSVVQVYCPLSTPYAAPKLYFHMSFSNSLIKGKLRKAFKQEKLANTAIIVNFRIPLAL